MKQALRWGLRLGFAAFFLHSGWIKLVDMPAFAESVHRYQLLPLGLVFPGGLMMAWLEVWAGAALLTLPRLRLAGWAWVLLLLLLFTAAKISALARGLDIPCGCGTSTDPMELRDVIQNFVLIALSAAALRLELRTVSFPQPQPPETPA